MLRTVEAEIDTNGNVRLLEPVEVKKTTRAIVTLLEDANGAESKRGNAEKVLKFLRENRLPEEARSTPEQIEEIITENRNSWD